MASNVSNISQALAGKPTLLNIPNSAPANFVGHQGFAVPKRNGGAIGLLTPPNSISPNLPPQAFKVAKYPVDVAGSPPSQVDSDIDLQDAVEHERSQARQPHGLSTSGDDVGSSEGVGIITPVYLAKFHLAELLLEKGPIAIRHVMNHLSQTVPGFNEVPPAKARRIVVAALESRAGGGARGDVEFEKVGWGRWDARVGGQPAKSNRSIYPIREGYFSETQGTPTAALRIPGSDRRASKSRRISHGSWPAETSLPSRFEHVERPQRDVAEDEADKMSIDGDEEEQPRQRQSSAYALRAAQPENYSDTDEEDWGSLGATALRNNSYSSSASGVNKHGIHSYMRPGSARRSTSFSPHPSSMQNSASQQLRRGSSRGPEILNLDRLDFTGVDVDPQEREAIQALLRMGSV